MAEESTTTSITRQAPYREEYEKAILQALLGTAGSGGITGGLIQKPISIPEVQVAPMAQETLQAYNLAKAGLGGYRPYLQAAQQAIGQATPMYGQAASTMGLGIGALQAGQGQYDPMAATGGVSQFMSPYQQMVTKEAMKEIDRQGAIAQGAQSAEAVKAGAFGGGREGVQRAELARNIQDIKSKRIAEDMQANYAQALGASMDAYQQARARDIMTGQALGQAGVSQAGIGELYANLAGQQVGLGTAQQGFLGQDVGVLESMGANLQKQQQLALDAQRQTQMQQAYEPYQRLGYASDLLRGLPTAQTTVGTATAPGVSPVSQLLGAGMAGTGIYGALTNAPWASNFMGAYGAMNKGTA
jgi:hypothetical protein